MLDARLLIYGYGSLIWRPSFDYEKRWPACAVGWARRFWQGSPDHRGTPEAPGRVVTLVPEPGARCWGVVYEIAAERGAAVLEELDRREQGGYTRREIEVLAGAEGVRHTASVYIAVAGNPHWLGAAAPPEIARQIRAARGPSGPNPEYLLRLARALRELGSGDEHVLELVALVTPETFASEGP